MARAIRLTLWWAQGAQEGLPFVERITQGAYNFFILGIQPFWNLGKSNIFTHLWAFGIYTAFIISLIRKIRVIRGQTLALLAMLSVDIGIHVICGWALNEAWMFAPHWIWMIPLIIFGRGSSVHELRELNEFGGSKNG